MNTASTLITSAFGARSSALSVVADLSLTGKNVLVTGGASGLGFETSRALAAAGASVTLAVRQAQQGLEAKLRIEAEFKHAKIRLAHLDLSDHSSIQQLGNAWASAKRPLHMLINNAAIMACPLTRTSQGFEAQFATNHLGHFLLGQALMPAVLEAAQQTGDARIVTLSSSGHKISNVIFDDIHYERRDYNKWTAYGQAKTANALYSLGLHLRYAASGVTSNAVHPGGIMTPLQRYLPIEEMRAMGWLKADDTPLDIFKSPEQGASTSVWAATSPLLKGHGGMYLEDCKQSVVQPASNRVFGYCDYLMDADAAEQLWDLSLRAMSRNL